MLNSSFERSYLTILCHCGKLMLNNILDIGGRFFGACKSSLCSIKSEKPESLTVQRKTAAAVNTCGRQVTTTVRNYQWAQRGGPVP